MDPITLCRSTKKSIIVWVYLAALGRPRTVGQIAFDLELDQRTIYSYCRSLAALGLLGLDGDQLVALPGLQLALPLPGAQAVVDNPVDNSVDNPANSSDANTFCAAQNVHLSKLVKESVNESMDLTDSLTSPQNVLADPELRQDLLAAGLYKSVADQLLASYDADLIRRQLAYWSWRRSAHGSQSCGPGYLAFAIRRNLPAPDGYQYQDTSGSRYVSGEYSQYIRT